MVLMASTTGVALTGVGSTPVGGTPALTFVTGGILGTDANGGCVSTSAMIDSNQIKNFARDSIVLISIPPPLGMSFPICC